MAKSLRWAWLAAEVEGQAALDTVVLEVEFLALQEHLLDLVETTAVQGHLPKPEAKAQRGTEENQMDNHLRDETAETVAATTGTLELAALDSEKVALQQSDVVTVAEEVEAAAGLVEVAELQVDTAVLVEVALAIATLARPT